MIEIPAALVTGASRGIGAAIARRLAADGFAVIVNSRASDDASGTVVEAIRKDAGTAEHLSADVGDAEAVAHLFLRIRERFGRLDCLVNNAAVTCDRPLTRMREEEWRQVIDTNLTGSWRCAKHAVRLLRKSENASIVHIGSSGAFYGNPGQSNYGASKGGVTAMARSLARELGPAGIRVNCVVPGFTKTGMTEDLPAEHWQAILEATPLGRLCEPADVAAAVSFFVSPQAAGITGQVLVVDGGRI